ncbi:stranded at second isoform X2 [Ptiloglossa arizonensis]|uniref:stranded at second isoform X2 n=1 Tax=Ptiloglossa arizonensis TaxID=3350558 RepID=UPI003FA00875
MLLRERGFLRAAATAALWLLTGLAVPSSSGLDLDVAVAGTDVAETTTTTTTTIPTMPTTTAVAAVTAVQSLRDEARNETTDRKFDYPIKEQDSKTTVEPKKKPVDFKPKTDQKYQKTPKDANANANANATEAATPFRGRALNVSAPEPANSLRSNITDLSDVSMDDDEDEREDDRVEEGDASRTANLSSTRVCVEGNRTYSASEKILRGCEEKCVCGEDGAVTDCKPLCSSPYVRADRGIEDPLCQEKLVAEEPCCAILVCAADSAPEPEETCLFANKTIARGQRVEDGCSRVCVCEAGGGLECRSRCPPNETSSSPTAQHDRCVVLTDPRDSCCTITLCDVTLGDHEIRAETSADPSVDLTDAKVLNSTAIKLELATAHPQDVTVEISDKNRVWRQQRPDRDGVLGNLEPARTYYVRVVQGTRTGPALQVFLPAEVVKTNVSSPSSSEGSCGYRGKTYDPGAEWYDECISFCVCADGGKTECATIECPTDFGLDVLDPRCLDWETVPASFVPKPPRCCPQEVRCSNNGSCDYKGNTYDNWSELPTNVTGCEKRCYCEMGNVSCQAACPPVPALPPASLPCPSHRATLSHLPGDDCCTEWSCARNSDGIPIPGTTATPAFPGPGPGPNQETEHVRGLFHYPMDPGHPTIPYNGPYGPDYDPFRSVPRKEKPKKPLDALAKPRKDEHPAISDTSNENENENRVPDSPPTRNTDRPLFLQTTFPSEHRDPNAIVPATPKKKAASSNEKEELSRRPLDIGSHPGLLWLDRGPPEGHPALYDIHRRIAERKPPSETRLDAPQRIEELLARIGHREPNPAGPFQRYEPQSSRPLLDQSGLDRNVPPSSSDQVTVQILQALDENTVRLVFTVPQVLVGLHGRVELRYTNDKTNFDVSSWKSQVFAPSNDLIATPQLEFELTDLKPSTEYKVKIAVKLKDLANSPSSKIYSVRTLEKRPEATTFPPRIPIDAELRATEVNTSWINFAWKKFTEYELRFVDGVQLRYKEQDGKLSSGTPLIHRAVNNYAIENLKPSTAYEVGIFFLPFPGQATELVSEKTIRATTSMEPDPYSFRVNVEIEAIESTDVQVAWTGVPYPEDKYVNVYRAVYQSDSGNEDASAFKIAKRDSRPRTVIDDLKPGTRYRLWLEVYLTNGKIKKSNVQDFVTKPGVLLPATVSQQAGKFASLPIRDGDYYGPLVVVAIVASLAILSTLVLSMMLLKRRTSSKADISPRKTTSAYNNPSYKVELQQETMDL